MLDQLTGPWKIIATIGLFPMFFQGTLLHFAWGPEDELGMAVLKRVFILLPTAAVIASCWITIACAVSIIIRHKRREFTAAIFITWWDLGRAIFSFWGGIFKFLYLTLGWLAGIIRIGVLGILMSIKDLVLLPARMLGEMSQQYFKPGVPWPTVILTVFWCLLEALIFTVFMTEFVADVIESVAGQAMSGLTLQIPMYLTFVVFVFGSYAVLEAFGEAIKARQITRIVNLAIVEIIVAMVEVVFFYREFVEALVPWFAQHAGNNFELGPIGALGIAAFAWTGIRAMTWFLFGSTGVPTLMAILQRTGLDHESGGGLFRSKPEPTKSSIKSHFVFIGESIAQIKKDMDWVEQKADLMLSAFVLPPLHVVAAVLNFATLLISSNHLFDLPFRSYKELLEARELVQSAKKTIDKD